MFGGTPFAFLRGLRGRLTQPVPAPVATPPTDRGPAEPVAAVDEALRAIPGVLVSAPVPTPPTDRGPAEPVAAVDDALRAIPGLLAPALVALGANGIRTVEDLAACATDDLVGWTEEAGGKTTTHAGILGDTAMSRQQCDAIILQARIRAGWIEAAAPTS